MDSVQQQLEDLMSVNADTELQFDDGVLKANSTVLSIFSNVLRGAIEAHTAGGPQSNIVIPMQGLTKEQWLEFAAFWHPVEQTPVVQTWAEAELLLRVGSRFNLHPVLDKASSYLVANMDKLTATPAPSISSSTDDGSSSSTDSGADMTVWKWLLLGDELHLTSCLPALARRAVEVDRAGCSNKANTHGLSAATLQELLAALQDSIKDGPYSVGQLLRRRCQGSCGAYGHPQHIVCLRCCECNRYFTS